MSRVEADGASPEEIAAIVAALEALRAGQAEVSVEPVRSRWRIAARSIDDGYDALLPERPA